MIQIPPHRVAQHDGIIFKTLEKFFEGDYLIGDGVDLTVMKAEEFERIYEKKRRFDWTTQTFVN